MDPKIDEKLTPAQRNAGIALRLNQMARKVRRREKRFIAAGAWDKAIVAAKDAFALEEAVARFMPVRS